MRSRKHSQVKLILAFTIAFEAAVFLSIISTPRMLLAQSFMMLGQEAGVLLAEPFLLLITLDSPFIPSTFVARRKALLLSYRLQQMMILE